jgi:predicted nicotinamide N-methyase
VASDRVYADEATEADATARLEAALASLNLAEESSSGDADPASASLRDALEAARSACAEASRLVATTREVSFGAHVVRVRELALGRGVGAKLWRAASMLARDLVADPGWCEGQSVLELGAGVGLCGLLAAKLGARRVVLTDFEFPLLDSLAVAARENFARGDATAASVARCDWREEAAECDDSFRVMPRDARERAGGEERLKGTKDDANGPVPETEVDAAAVKGGWSPRLAVDDVFERILGSDLLYERAHAETLPRVCARRLAKPRGVCRIVGAVRDRGYLDTLVRASRSLGLIVAETKARENAGDDWYEDGYAALEMRWENTTRRTDERSSEPEPVRRT